MGENQLDILHLVLNASIVVKLVIILLILFSVYTWAIVLMKFSAYKKLKKENINFLNKFKSFESIFDITSEDLISDSMLKPILSESIGELKKIENAGRSENGFSSFGFSTLERTIENSISESSLSLRQFNSTLASISSIAPFVGLFGTVWGIINSFQGLAGGGGSVQAVAPGIAEALVATAIGLAAAIPANWFFNKFTSDAAQMEQQLESFGKEVINLVERSV